MNLPPPYAPQCAWAAVVSLLPLLAGCTIGPPRPTLPAETVAEWRAAGAQVGTMEDHVFRPEGEHDYGLLPAFRFTQATAQSLSELSAPQRSFGLDFSSSTIGDEQAKELTRFQRLRMLNLNYTDVSKECVAELKRRLPRCSIEYFRGAQPPPAEIIALTELVGGGEAGYFDDHGGIDEFVSQGYETQTPTVKLADWKPGTLTQLQDPGIPFGIDFAYSDMTDEQLQSVPPLENLVSLDLNLTKVTDASMEHVATYSNLETLTLRSTTVGDAGLKQLHNLKNLEWINLWDTQVTPAGVAAFEKALPECKVYYE